MLAGPFLGICEVGRFLVVVSGHFVDGGVLYLWGMIWAVGLNHQWRYARYGNSNEWLGGIVFLIAEGYSCPLCGERCVIHIHLSKALCIGGWTGKAQFEGSGVML
jgi:hypothetical protein